VFAADVPNDLCLVLSHHIKRAMCLALATGSVGQWLLNKFIDKSKQTATGLLPIIGIFIATVR